jgi:hypothetical protein
LPGKTILKKAVDAEIGARIKQGWSLREARLVYALSTLKVRMPNRVV